MSAVCLHCVRQAELIQAGNPMTASQYKRIEELLQKVEDITGEHPLLTPQGHQVRADVQGLLAHVVVERIRAENREDVTAPPLKLPHGS